MLLGVGLWVGFSVHFNAKDKLSYEPNPGCIKGSPYGKVLALAMQGPIDLYWHSGQTHESAEILNAEHQHSDGTVHKHADHGHQHSDDHHGHHDHHGHEGHEGHKQPKFEKVEIVTQIEEEAVTREAPEKPLVQRAKDKIKLMSATAKRKTDGSPLSPSHRKYLQSVIEDKLRLAYELDPTNYTNYGNLHLFLTSTNLGKESADDSKALRLAQKTLEVCKKEEVDPASWVTAASAAYNIIFHIGRYYDQYTVAEAKASLKEFDDCIVAHQDLLDGAVENGRILSEARLNEFNERVRYMKKIRYAQGVYMKRMMTTHMTGKAQPGTTH